MTARGQLWRRGVGAAAAVLSAVSVTAACGVTVENLPLPKPSVEGDTYRVHAIFEDALNLPAEAKVKIGGSDIGQVTDITTSNYTADVEMQIRSDIALPANSTAELRQATPLGDVFVALTIPPDQAGQPRIADGGTIALPQTSAGATVEELLTSLSMLLNGGGLNELATITNELDSIVSGHGPELEHLLVEMTDVIGSLNQRTVEIDATLQGFDATLATVNQNSAALGAVADALPPMIGTFAENTATIGDLMAQISVTSAALGDFAKTTGDRPHRPGAQHRRADDEPVADGRQPRPDPRRAAPDRAAGECVVPGRDARRRGHHLLPVHRRAQRSVRQSLAALGSDRHPWPNPLRRQRVHRQPHRRAEPRVRPDHRGLLMSWIRTHKVLLANLALVLVFLVGAGYLLVSIMRIDPTRAHL